MHVVGDHDNGNPQGFVDFLQKVHDLRVMPVVLASGRLIQYHDLRIHHQYGGNGHSLFLPEAKGRYGPVPEGIQAADFQCFMNSLPDLLLGNISHRKAQSHLVENHGL